MMNQYNNLIQSLVKVKHGFQTRLNIVIDQIENNNDELDKIKNDVIKNRNQLEEYNEKLNIIHGFKAFIKKQIIKCLKWGSICLASSFGGVLLIELLSLLFTKEFFASNIIGSFLLAAFFCTTITTVIFLSETKYEREVYKENKQYPFMISEIIKAIKKDLEKNNEKQKEYTLLLEQSEAEKQKLKDIIETCDGYLSYLMSRVREVSCYCKQDIEAINEVYEYDESLEDIMKLVRNNSY